MNVKHQTTPTAAASHAAYVACMAARAARRAGCTEAECARVHAAEYRMALVSA